MNWFSSTSLSMWSIYHHWIYNLLILTYYECLEKIRSLCFLTSYVRLYITGFYYVYLLYWSPLFQPLPCSRNKTFQGAKILLASHFDFEYVLGHKIAFLCIAKGTPRPHITWFKDGVEIFAHHYLHVCFHLLYTYI